MKWYFTWNRPKMKAAGGAFWPVMAIKTKYENGTSFPKEFIEDTIRHEEAHMKTQLSMLLFPWLILYVLFLIHYGYKNNPFERWARLVAEGIKWKPFGWVRCL